MPFIKRPIRLPWRFGVRLRPRARAVLKLVGAVVVLLGIISLIVLPTNHYLDAVASRTAVTKCSSLLAATVNNTVNERLSSGDYGYDYFVNLQHDAAGNVIAIAANMARINMFASEILGNVIEATQSDALKLKIPLGTLLGSTLFLDRGPKIPIKLMILTSSFAGFRNEFVSVGINQSKHQIILEVKLQLDVVLPWEIQHTEVSCEVLIAETIIVGKVPDTYLGINP